MATMQISEDSEWKFLYEDARIAEARKIVAEADAAISAKALRSLVCEWVAHKTNVPSWRNCTQWKMNGDISTKDPICFTDSFLEEERKKGEAVLLSSSQGLYYLPYVLLRNMLDTCLFLRKTPPSPIPLSLSSVSEF